MREHTIKLYSFDELSEAAQKYAYRKHGYIFYDDFGHSYRPTLREFERCFDVTVTSWELDSTYYTFNYRTNNDVGIYADPLRIARYVWNNYSQHVEYHKIYNTWKPLYITVNGIDYRRNKPQPVRVSNNTVLGRGQCVLTGEYPDENILTPIFDCLEYKRLFASYDDLIETCLHEFFTAWQKDIEHTDSFEYFEEMVTLNDYEFLETGEMWNE